MEKYESIIIKVINQFQGLDYHLKEDLKQELRIFIYQNKVKIESEAEKIERYLFVTLKRQVINWLKHSKYRKYYSLNQITESGDEYVDLIVSKEPEDCEIEQLDILDSLDNILNKQEKILINEYFRKGLTYKEIGKRYDVSADTVRRRLSKILDKIRRWWI